MMWQYSDSWNWWAYLGMAAQMVVGILILAFLISVFLHWLGDRDRIQLHADPLDILRQRYARGEINETTFATMSAHLTPRSQPSRPQDTPTEGSLR